MKHLPNPIGLLLLLALTATMAGCQDKADSDQNPAATQKHNTLQPASNDPTTPASTPSP